MYFYFIPSSELRSGASCFHTKLRAQKWSPLESSRHRTATPIGGRAHQFLPSSTLGSVPGRRPMPPQPDTEDDEDCPASSPSSPSPGSSSPYSPRHGPPTCPGRAPSPPRNAGASSARVGVLSLPSPHHPQQPTHKSRVQQQHSGSSGTASIPAGGSSTFKVC